MKRTLLRSILMLVVMASGTVAQAQDAGWGNLDSLLLSTLSNTGSMEASYWLPNHPDPAQASVALGIAYIHIPGSAGSVSIGTGIYRKSGGWSLERHVSGLFGMDPKDHMFKEGVAEITTLMQGPNDPRCCPSMPVRWQIDLSTGAASKLP